MAKEVAEMVYDNMSQMTDKMMDALKKLMAKLMDVVDFDSNKDKAAKALAKWIKDGKAVAHYAIQGGCEGQLKSVLRENHIPFISCTDGSIIVRTSDDPLTNDLAVVQELNHDILLAKGNYFQEADIKDFEDAIANHKGEDMQDIFSLTGVDNYELEVIKNKCNNISKGFTVAHSKSEDNPELNDLCIMGRRVITFSKEKPSDRIEKPKYKKDFCRATLQAMLSLYGPNEENKKRQIDDDALFDAKVAALKEDNGVHYIVGQYDSSKYIELSPEGFTYYDYKNAKNPIMSKFSTSDINYKGELQVAMDCIYNKALIDSPDLLNKHLSGNQEEIKSDRAKRSREQILRSRAESDISIKIDTLIKTRMESSMQLIDEKGNLKKSPKVFFKLYCSEAVKIIEAVRDGKELSNYDAVALQDIKNAFKKGKLDINAYNKSIEKLTSFNTDIHKARKYTKEELAKERKNATERMSASYNSAKDSR